MSVNNINIGTWLRQSDLRKRKHMYVFRVASERAFAGQDSEEPCFFPQCQICYLRRWMGYLKVWESLADSVFRSHGRSELESRLALTTVDKTVIRGGEYLLFVCLFFKKTYLLFLEKCSLVTSRGSNVNVPLAIAPAPECRTCRTAKHLQSTRSCMISQQHKPAGLHK